MLHFNLWFFVIDYVKKMAAQCRDEKHRVYSVITDRKGNILGEACNSYVKSHTLQKHYAVKANQPTKEFLHSEISSIIKASKTKRKMHSIWIARIGRNGLPRNSKPCSICEMAIEEAGIKNIFYTE